MQKSFARLLFSDFLRNPRLSSFLRSVENLFNFYSVNASVFKSWLWLQRFGWSCQRKAGTFYNFIGWWELPKPWSWKGMRAYISKNTLLFLLEMDSIETFLLTMCNIIDFEGFSASCKASIWWESTTNYFDTKASWQHVHRVSLCSICIPYSQQAYRIGEFLTTIYDTFSVRNNVFWFLINIYNFQEGKRVILFSYGSGLTSTMFSLQLRATQNPFSLANIVKVMDVAGKLKSRHEVLIHSV